MAKYYSTGITISPADFGDFNGVVRWKVTSDFTDDLFCDESSTEGTMKSRYLVEDVVEAAKTLKEDMENLGIVFGIGEVEPTVYFFGDSESEFFPLFAEDIDKVCKALGWQNMYNKESNDHSQSA